MHINFNDYTLIIILAIACFISQHTLMFQISYYSELLGNVALVM